MRVRKRELCVKAFGELVGGNPAERGRLESLPEYSIAKGDGRSSMFLQAHTLDSSSCGTGPSPLSGWNDENQLLHFCAFSHCLLLPSSSYPHQTDVPTPTNSNPLMSEQQSPGFPTFRRFSNVRLRSVSLPTVPSSHPPRRPVDDIKPSTPSDH